MKKQLNGWVVVWKTVDNAWRGDRNHVCDVFFTNRRKAVTGAKVYEKLYPNRIARVCSASVSL